VDGPVLFTMPPDVVTGRGPAYAGRPAPVVGAR
jgi:hypothetical protein